VRAPVMPMLCRIVHTQSQMPASWAWRLEAAARLRHEARDYT
jgi:hypothetical protein